MLHLSGLFDVSSFVVSLHFTRWSSFLSTGFYLVRYTDALFWQLNRWSVSTYLFTRVLRKGHDSRFDRAKHKPRRFAIFWFGQAVWVICVCMPSIAVNSIPLGAFKHVPSAKDKEQEQSQVESGKEDEPAAKHEKQNNSKQCNWNLGAFREATKAARATCKGQKLENEKRSGRTSTSTRPTTTITATEKLSLILFLFGFAVENLADYQKNKWWDQKRRKVHREDFLTKGLWGRRLVFLFVSCFYPSWPLF